MWCPNLRLLSVVVGGINIFTSLGFTISIIISLCYYDHKEFQNAPFDDSSCLGLVTLIILIFLSAVWTSFSIMLIVGIYENRYRLMAPWIYFQYGSIGFVLLVALVDAVKEIIEKIPFSVIFLEFVIISIITGIVALCLFPVFKFYESMRWLAQQPQRDDWGREDQTTDGVADDIDESKIEGDT